MKPSMKLCKICFKILPVSDYYPKNLSCKKCVIKRNTLRNQTSYRQRRNELGKKRYRTNLQVSRLFGRRQSAKYRLCHQNDPIFKTTKKEYDRISYLRHHEERLRKIRSYYKLHVKQITAQVRERRRTSPYLRLVNRLRSRLRVALKGIAKADSTFKLVGCSVSELLSHLERQFQSGMTWENMGKWHVDHIRPCASFDLTDPEQQRQCFHYTNLQPLWAEDNWRKHAKISQELTVKLSENS